MQKTLLAIMLVAVLTVTGLGANEVYAQISDAELEAAAGEVVQAVFIAGGSGGAMGAVYAIIRVGGKNLRAAFGNGKKPEPIVIGKLLGTVVIGGIAGAVLQLAGLDYETATGFSTIIVIFSTEILTVIFGHRVWRNKKNQSKSG